MKNVFTRDIQHAQRRALTLKHTHKMGKALNKKAYIAHGGFRIAQEAYVIVKMAASTISKI